MTISEQALELFLPENTLQWFDITDSTKDSKNIRITLTEKNKPPVKEGCKAISRGFHDITITDFPARGKRVLLTFRRRHWKIEGQQEYLKRDIKLNFPGTKLNKEFADFLKDGGGERSGFPNFYRQVSAPPTENI